MNKPKKERKSFTMTDNKINVKVFANREEKRIEKVVNGKRTPRSGAINTFAGDIMLKDELVDVKSISDKTKQMIVTEDMLKKIEKEAYLQGRVPVIIINFTNKRSLLNNKEWILLPLKSYRLKNE